MAEVICENWPDIERQTMPGLIEWSDSTEAALETLAKQRCSTRQGVRLMRLRHKVSAAEAVLPPSSLRQRPQSPSEGMLATVDELR